MIDLIEEINYHKLEKDNIKSEINDLESRIFVESGRNNRFEVNNYRNRINRLKMRLDEINLKIVELEKMNKNQNQNQIQVMPIVDLNVPAVKNGEITVTDTIEFDCGSYDAPEIIQTVTKTVERTIRYKNGQPVSCKEKYNETSTTRRLGNAKDNFIEISIAD